MLLAAVTLNTIMLVQAQDSLITKQLNEVVVKGYRTLNGIGHFESSQGQVIYAGKKTEVILVDSLDANKAINNTRQILGRIPGIEYCRERNGRFCC